MPGPLGSRSPSSEVDAPGDPVIAIRIARDLIAVRTRWPAILDRRGKALVEQVADLERQPVAVVRVAYPGGEVDQAIAVNRPQAPLDRVGREQGELLRLVIPLRAEEQVDRAPGTPAIIGAERPLPLGRERQCGASRDHGRDRCAGCLQELVDARIGIRNPARDREIVDRAEHDVRLGTARRDLPRIGEARHDHACDQVGVVRLEIVVLGVERV